MFFLYIKNQRGDFMKKRVIKNLLLIGGLGITAPALYAAGPSGAMLAGTCAACHGTNGSSVGITPSLAGGTAEYFIDTMQAFKYGDRDATVMDRVAKGYSDEQIAKMGEFFAKQKLKPMKQTFDSSKAALGKKLHEDNCEKCHEDGGRKADEGGILAGQSMIYLKYSMEDFHSNSRETPKKMKKKVKAVTSEHGQKGIEALIHYYGSQQ